MMNKQHTNKRAFISFRNKKRLKFIAAFLMVNFLTPIIAPVGSYALTSGPTQPEFTSFEPVATTNMVNPFTGDFTYNLPVVNIPGPNGSGYAMSLSYHSGSGVESEASWVGYGWTLNPGAIVRNNNGNPDDSKGSAVKHWNKIKPITTITAGFNANPEVFSADFPFSLGAGLRYNNYKGFGYVANIGLDIANGLISLGFSVSEDGHSFSASINPGALLKNKKAAKEKKKAEDEYKMYVNKKAYLSNKGAMDSWAKSAKAQSGTSTASSPLSKLSAYATNSFTKDFSISDPPEFNGIVTNVGFTFQIDPAPVHAGPEVGGRGTVVVQSTKEDSKDINHYGYLYQGYALSDNSVGDDKKAMDYYNEMESGYNSRDKFLPIPFNNQDVFGLTGEGLAGSIRLHRKKAGHYYPINKSSVTTSVNASAEAAAGLNFEVPGTGFNVGFGRQKLEIKNWSNTGNTSGYQFEDASDEAVFMRFDGDMSGNLNYSDDDDAYRASLNVTDRNIPFLKNASPQIASAEFPANTDRMERSSYVGYHTNSEMEKTIYSEKLDKDIYYKAYSRRDFSNFIDRTDSDVEDQIGEISTTTEDGNRYVYGLPVFNSNEKKLSFGLYNETFNTGPEIINNSKVYKNIDDYDNIRSISGTEDDKPHATNYLLTEITTSDYIDRTLDGPTSDDFGGYTTFDYIPLHGGNSDKSVTSTWFPWRAPYKGLSYGRGQIHDIKDDFGTVSTGKKEIYYLNKIETKTHVAFFVTNNSDDDDFGFTHNESYDIEDLLTGSGTDRTDATGASDWKLAARDKNYSDDTYKQSKLEKIVVFAKKEDGVLTGKPIKVTNLEYATDANALCQGIPNSSNDGGKLTLKRVWFEYEGIVHARIRPYEFDYEYKVLTDFNSDEIKTKYLDIIEDTEDFDAADQNPDYDEFGQDAWGNYRKEGADRSTEQTPWVDQTPLADFDPAAWQMKTIKMPSGGEILVQYEQDDYKYVQDKNAMQMVSLTNDTDEDNNKFYIDATDYDIDLDGSGTIETTEIDAFRALIEKEYVSNGKKIYFKFLYRLIGESFPTIDIEDDCSVEYIDGYADVASVVKDGTKIYIEIDDSESHSIPLQVCEDFARRNAMKPGLGVNCGQNSGSSLESQDAINAVKSLANMIRSFVPGEVCKSMSPQYSYLRVPVLKNKKGGGVRVKRILMYDKGLESDNLDEVLYGSEYRYIEKDGTSSGVATNEPASIREENALTTFLDKRTPQSMLKKIISGRDKEQFEGPIGESLLPSPSVGYARVVINNIHSGKTGTGYAVHEFITAKEAPYTFEAGVDHTDPKPERAFFLLPAIFFNAHLDKRWVSQGYSFVTNNFHGQPKRVATYGESCEGAGNESLGSLSSEQIYEYYGVGEDVPVLNEDGKSITLQNMGREEEVAMEMKSVKDNNDNFSVQLDFSASIVGIVLPNFSFMPSVSMSDRLLNTHVTSKVINYPAIQKATISYQDGIYHRTEHKAFSPWTGKPVISATFDGYDKLDLQQSSDHVGTYTAYSVPAIINTPQLGPKYQNEGLKVSTDGEITEVGDGRYQFTLKDGNGDPDNAMITSGQLVDGDLIRVYCAAGNLLYYVDELNSSTAEVIVQPLSILDYHTFEYSYIEIVRSGYTNQLNTSMASITTYGHDYETTAIPPAPMASGSDIKIADLSKVLSASVITFSDNWSDDYTNDIYGTTEELNDFESGRRGKWRVKDSYAYRDDITGSTEGTERTYTGGYITTFEGYNFTNEASNDDDKWLKGSTVTIYSPNGIALEEENILGIKSTAKYGYGESVPVLVAQNAAYASVGFESFEDKSGSTVVTTEAHSGANSKELAYNAIHEGQPLTLDQHLKDYGFVTKFWLKTPDGYPEDINSAFDFYLDIEGTNVNGTLSKIARVGEWTLVDCEITTGLSGFTVGDVVVPKYKNSNIETVYIDDIRIQPDDSQMAAYVYDNKNLRLLATFDDQNFGMYYQYNAEGQLVRTLIETERGMKTVKETQYNIPWTDRQ